MTGKVTPGGHSTGAPNYRLRVLMGVERILSVTSAIQTLHDLVTREAPGSPVAMYLTGSYCHGGLRPDSDLDILLITRVPLRTHERRTLTEHLLGYSGRRATSRPGRPIELISLALNDIKPWRYPAIRDFLYGEWLRADYEAGRLPHREPDPNLPVVLTSAREHLTQAMYDDMPSLLDNLVGDERNVLLTLARILFTLRTGLIAPKDEAAAHVCAILEAEQADTLDLAARAYRGEARDDWTGLPEQTSVVAAALTDRIYAIRT